MSVATNTTAWTAGAGSPNAAAPPDIAASLQALQTVLGAEAVQYDRASLDRYARSTGPHGTRPLAVVYPTSTEQVCQVVRVADCHGLSVYPISKGKNWGYSDACAPTNGQVIMDLGRLNRIIEVNRQLGYAVIEPGVTQGQLWQYLKEHQTGLWMDATGAGVDASLVGNTLDHGFGHTPYGDHFLNTCGMTVVMADGRVLKTGFGEYPNAKAHRTYRYGVGPFLDGIFAQSNLGIVTEIGIWLMPKPESFCAFFFTAPHFDDLQDIVDRLAPLRLHGLIRSALHIGNDLRVISARTRYPFDRTNGATPLPKALRAELGREYGVGAWNGAGAICGPRGCVRAVKQAVRRALRPYHVRFVDDRTLKLAKLAHRLTSWSRPGKRLGELLAVLTPIYALMQGEPSDEPLRGAAWRVRDPEPELPTDPLDVHAGLMWVSPVLPISGTAAAELMALLEPIYEQYSFEALVTFTMITERAMICVTNLAFDQRQTEEAARAVACYDQLMDTMIAAGYIPYRTGTRGCAKLTNRPSVFWDVAGQIKAALDPAGIISPGRYQRTGKSEVRSPESGVGNRTEATTEPGTEDK